MIEVKNLKISFGDLHVIKDISINIEKGEKIVVIGPSGSGKSTMLRILVGLETADSGNIDIEGRVGLVFQNFNLFPHYSIMKNIIEIKLLNLLSSSVLSSSAIKKSPFFTNKENADNF